MPGHPPEGRAPGVWLASFKQHSAVHGKAGKSAASVAPAGRFDAAKGGSLDTSDGRRVVSSSPDRGPWTAGGSGEMPGGVFEVLGGLAVSYIFSLFLARRFHLASNRASKFTLKLHPRNKRLTSTSRFQPFQDDGPHTRHRTTKLSLTWGPRGLAGAGLTRPGLGRLPSLTWL